MKNRITFVALAAFLCVGAASARTPPYAKLRFGLMEGGSYDTLHVARETTHIPKRVHTSLPYYGFEVRTVGPEEHHVQAIVHVPRATSPRAITMTMQRLGVLGITHGADDPLGHYTVDLLIDDKPWKTVEYDLAAE